MTVYMGKAIFATLSRTGIDTSSGFLKCFFYTTLSHFACESATANASWLCVRGFDHRILADSVRLSPAKAALDLGFSLDFLIPHFACESATDNFVGCAFGDLITESLRIPLDFR